MAIGSPASVFPGIVGMHDHLFYMAQPRMDAAWHWEEPYLITEMAYSAPRLYLAGGVTTMRTTGSAEPDTDLSLARQIEAGTLPIDPYHVIPVNLFGECLAVAACGDGDDSVGMRVIDMIEGDEGV